MMKINELMLGDWLIYKGETICKVVGLDADISRLDNGELPTYWIH